MLDDQINIGGQPCARLSGIGKSFGTAKVVDNVSVEFMPGIVHAIVGENGAGKSSVGKIIGGYYSADTGEIELFGDKVSSLSPYGALNRGIAMIHQELQLVPELTVLQNVFLGAETNRFGVLSRGDLERFNQLESNCHFGLNPNAKVADLRIAERQKVEIMRAIARDAKMIIMDEPTSSLTQDEVEVLHNVIVQLRDEGRSVVYISHFLDHILEICDQVTIMRDGKVVKTVPIEGQTNDSLVEAMLGKTLDVMWPALPAPPPEGTPPLLEVVGIRTDTGLFDVSIAIRAGEIVSLIGLVGSGRTELARAIFGADPITSGTIRLEGAELTSHSVPKAIRAGIGLVPEDRRNQGLILTQTTRPNIVLSVLGKISHYGVICRKQEVGLVSEKIEHFNVVPKAVDGHVLRYSGGNQQKVLLAKWAAVEPKVMILDEPSRGVDVGARQRIHEHIVELAASGACVLLISSEMEEAIKLSHRGYLMDDGRIFSEVECDGLTVDHVLSKIFEAQSKSQQKKEDQ